MGAHPLRVEGAVGAQEVLELRPVEHSGRGGIGGLGGCVLQAQCREKREGEGEQERRCLWENGVGLLCACVCRVCAKMGPHSPGCEQQGALRAPPTAEDSARCPPQRESGIYSLSSGFPWIGWVRKQGPELLGALSAGWFGGCQTPPQGSLQRP